MWVLQGNSGATSNEQCCYFCVGNSTISVTGYCIADHSNLAVYVLRVTYVFIKTYTIIN